MNCRLSFMFVMSVALFVSPPLLVGNSGGGHSGGGHSGSGSHGGGHAGAGSSGHSIGHAVGHSFGRILGHHSGDSGSRQAKKPGSRGNPVSPPPVDSMHRVVRRRMFHRSRSIRSGYCASLRFSWRDFLFPGEFDCFNDAFVSDPFFYGASVGAYFWSDSLVNSGDSAGSVEAMESVENHLSASAGKPGAAIPLPSNVKEPVVLLQLLDGSMYGVTRYWLEGTELHYVTDYGGENSVPLVRIDLAKTIALNAARGVRVDLTRSFPNP